MAWLKVEKKRRKTHAAKIAVKKSKSEKWRKEKENNNNISLKT